MNNIEYKHFDIIFFDTPFAQLKRFCANVATQVKELRPTISMAAVVLVQAPKSMPIKMEDCPKELFDIFDSIILFDDIDDIDTFLNQTSPKFLFFGANRIPDLEIVLHAKKMGIKTYLLQHGLTFKGCCINEFTPHNSFLALKTADKVFNYLKILKRMSKYDKTPFFKVLKKVFLRRGDLQALAMKSYSIPLTCDKAFVLGEEWKDYYVQNFGYERDDLILMGSHDLDSFDESLKPEQAICYIANAVVEEGAVSRKEFLNFINYFSSLVKGKAKIYVKLHPLSDKTLYSSLGVDAIFVEKQGDLPPATIYVAHHSSLIGKSLYYSDQLIIWMFKSDKICFYGDYASAVCKTKKELAAALEKLSINTTTHEKKEKISALYYKNHNGAFKTCAEYLINFYLEK